MLKTLRLSKGSSNSFHSTSISLLNGPDFGGAQPSSHEPLQTRGLGLTRIPEYFLEYPAPWKSEPGEHCVGQEALFIPTLQRQYPLSRTGRQTS